MECLGDGTSEEDDVPDAPATADAPNAAVEWAGAALADAPEAGQKGASSPRPRMDIPPLLPAAGRPKAAIRRGRRSALLLEALADARPKPESKPAPDRAAILEKARAAKKAKREAALGSGQPGEPWEAAVPRPLAEQELAISASFSDQTLRDIKSVIVSGAFGVSPLVPRCYH